MPGVPMSCWKIKKSPDRLCRASRATLLWQQHVAVITAVDLHPRINKDEVREAELTDTITDLSGFDKVITVSWVVHFLGHSVEYMYIDRSGHNSCLAVSVKNDTQNKPQNDKTQFCCGRQLGAQTIRDGVFRRMRYGTGYIYIEWSIDRWLFTFVVRISGTSLSPFTASRGNAIFQEHVSLQLAPSTLGENTTRLVCSYEWLFLSQLRYCSVTASRIESAWRFPQTQREESKQATSKQQSLMSMNTAHNEHTRWT